MAALAPADRPRRPTETILYAIVRDHLATFLAHARETYAAPLPRYVQEELRGYLRCRVFAHGFMRACDVYEFTQLPFVMCRCASMQNFSWFDLGDGEGILEIFFGDTICPTVSIHVVVMCDGGTAAWWEDEDGDALGIIRVAAA